MAEEKRRHRIRVLRRTPITTSPRPGETITTLAISYQADDRPVRTIWIDKDKWSPEAEKEMIKKELEELARAPEVEEYEV
jgi:hypothetical protein